MIETKNGLGFI